MPVSAGGGSGLFSADDEQKASMLRRTRQVLRQKIDVAMR